VRAYADLRGTIEGGFSVQGATLLPLSVAPSTCIQASISLPTPVLQGSPLLVAGATGPVFAATADGRLEPEPYEQEVLQLMASLKPAGLSLRALSRALAGHGAVSRSGRPFDPKALSRMLDDCGRSFG